jgi:glycine oxidase
MTLDTLIIGGGISGLSSAFRLAREGVKVAVLERDVLGMEASWAGGGILSPLLPWDYTAPINQLCHHSAQLYPQWIDEIRAHSSTNPEYWLCGMQVLLPFDDTNLLRWTSSTDEATYPGFSISRTDTGPLWLPNIAQVRNPRLISALREALTTLGVTVLEHSGTARLIFNPNSTAIQHVESAHGNHQAGAYLVCSGAWSQQILADAPPTKTITPVRGQMLLFRTTTNALNHIIYYKGTYLIPRRDGHLLAGSTLEHVGFDKSTTEEAKNRLMEQAFFLLPALRSATLEKHWSGLRPGSPDNIPTIARHPHTHNLYINAGHFRYGVTMAVTSSQIIADLINHRTPPLDIAPYAWG